MKTGDPDGIPDGESSPDDHGPAEIPTVGDIDQSADPDYEPVWFYKVGHIDPYGVEGQLVLRSEAGKIFYMRAFSGEVARYIQAFQSQAQEIPTVYRMVEEICEHSELVLVKIKIYNSAEVLRANLYFTGKKELILRNYRASDALALAAFYRVPILVKKTLLEEPPPPSR